MPQTKFQDVIFTIMMVLLMVYAMVAYNVSLDMGGLSNQVFLISLEELPLMGLIAFVLEFLIVGKLAQKLAFRLVTPGQDKMIFIILAISALTVCLMCPCMSLIATLLYKPFDAQFIATWIQTTILNFPMALCWQLFFAGPVVRLIFRTLFKKQLTNVK